MRKLLAIQQEIARLPIHESAFMLASDVVFSEEVRNLCKQNGCGMYGSCWACPPAVGSLEECKARCRAFRHAFLFTSASRMNGSFDIEGWLRAREDHEKLTDEVAAIFRLHDPAALILSTEGCLVCKTCNYPEAPCRFPERMYPALESFGIMVVQQANRCNIKYYNGTDTVTYFSMVFFDGD